MKCEKCNSNRILDVSGSDSVLDYSLPHIDATPDYVEGFDIEDFSFCMDCGQMQGKFPLPLFDCEKSFKKKVDFTKNAPKSVKDHTKKFLDYCLTKTPIDDDPIGLLENLGEDKDQIFHAFISLQKDKRFRKDIKHDWLDRVNVEGDLSIALRVLEDWEHYDELADILYPDED